MPRNTLESIIYEHALYGTGAMFSRYPDSREAPIQAHELRAAVEHARPLLQSEVSEYESQAPLQQIVRLYNATVIDGRFIDDLHRDPRGVAQRLGVELSDSAAAELREAGTTVANHFGSRFDFTDAELANGKKIVAVAIVAVIAIRAEARPYSIVIDSSGMIKV
jgi:hypothetical protein